MRILHSSDLHGDYSKLLETFDNETFDLWLDTGDFFPNWTRGDKNVEVPNQAAWFSNTYLRQFSARLLGRPMLSVSGNHDYISLPGLLNRFGLTASEVRSDNVFESNGLKFAGFREIPWIAGEWNGEQHSLSDVVDKTMALRPDVLVTHVPPQGILSDMWGSSELTNALTYYSHQVKHHFFGHVHEQGGEHVEEMDIKFYNGACNVKVFEVE